MTQIVTPIALNTATPNTTPAPLKILFAGTADFSASFLTPIINSHHEVVAVVTQMDKVSGRGKKVQMTNVKKIALEHNIPVYQFASSLRHPENYQQLLALDFDIMVVVAFGDILPVELLHHPKYQSINVHPSLLPLGRGASPVQSTIAKGDDHTAFCIIKMDATLDTGDILYWEDVAVDRYETSTSLFQKLTTVGTPILLKVLDNIEHYLAHAQPQAPLDVPEPKKTYTRKIKKESGRLKNHLMAITLERKLRAYDSWPGLFFAHPDQEGQYIKVLAAQAFDNWEQFQTYLSEQQLHVTYYQELTNCEQFTQLELGTIFAHSKQALYMVCGQGTILEISKLQLPGKKPVDFISIKNGYPNLLALGKVIGIIPEIVTA